MPLKKATELYTEWWNGIFSNENLHVSAFVSQLKMVQ